MSTSLVAVIVAIAVGPSTPTPTGAAFASTSVVVTDSSGVAQSPVLLTGAETPTPWAFTTSVAPGLGTVVATALDVNGVTLGTPITQSFTELGSPPNFLPPTGITVTPVSAVAPQPTALRLQAKKL
jgi:hypothetical protein